MWRKRKDKDIDNLQQHTHIPESQLEKEIKDRNKKLFIWKMIGVAIAIVALIVTLYFSFTPKS